MSAPWPEDMEKRTAAVQMSATALGKRQKRPETKSGEADYIGSAFECLRCRTSNSRPRRSSGLRLRLPAEVSGRELTHAMRHGDFQRARRAASPQTMASVRLQTGIGVGDEKSRDDLPQAFFLQRASSTDESLERINCLC